MATANREKIIEDNDRFSVGISAALTIGKIVMSDNIGNSMLEFRKSEDLYAATVARRMGICPSVVSDYEHGRRIPGVAWLKRYVIAIYSIRGKKI